MADWASDDLSENPWAIRRTGPTSYAAGVTQAGGQLIHRFEAGHRLVAGVTRSGKTFTTNAMLCGFAPRPDFALVGADPKKTGLTPWSPRATEIGRTLSEIDGSIERLLKLMDVRSAFLSMQGRDKWEWFDGPRLVFVCDEFADLAGLNTSAIDRTLEGSKLDQAFKGQQALAKIRTADIATLARMGAGLGIDVVISTQYPEAQVLPSQIRSQLDCRMVHRLSSKEQLAVCLGQGRADELDLREIRPGMAGFLWVTGTEDHEQTELARSSFVTVPQVAAHAARFKFLRWTWEQLLTLQTVADRAADTSLPAELRALWASYAPPEAA